MSTTKIGESTTKILKLLFFIINLHFDISNQIFTYRKLNLPLTRSGYFVFLPLEMKKKPEQTKVSHAFPYFISKETIHKPLKVAAAKTFSPVCQRYYIGFPKIYYIISLNIFEYLYFASINIFYSM